MHKPVVQPAAAVSKQQVHSLKPTWTKNMLFWQRSIFGGLQIWSLGPKNCCFGKDLFWGDSRSGVLDLKIVVLAKIYFLDSRSGVFLLFSK